MVSPRSATAPVRTARSIWSLIWAKSTRISSDTLPSSAVLGPWIRRRRRSICACGGSTSSSPKWARIALTRFPPTLERPTRNNSCSGRSPIRSAATASPPSMSHLICPDRRPNRRFSSRTPDTPRARYASIAAAAIRHRRWTGSVVATSASCSAILPVRAAAVWASAPSRIHASNEAWNKGCMRLARSAISSPGVPSPGAGSSVCCKACIWATNNSLSVTTGWPSASLSSLIAGCSTSTQSAMPSARAWM